MSNDTCLATCDPLESPFFVSLSSIAPQTVEVEVKVSSIRILLADDVESWRSSISSMLRTEASFEVVYETSDGLKAVQAAQKLQPAVVLLDIGLPGLNGIQAGAWIRKVSPFAKIVFVTMERDPDIVEAAWRLGARGYVLKSDAGRELVAVIHSVVRGEKVLSHGLDGHRFIDGVE